MKEFVTTILFFKYQCDVKSFTFIDIEKIQIFILIQIVFHGTSSRRLEGHVPVDISHCNHQVLDDR